MDIASSGHRLFEQQLTSALATLFLRDYWASGHDPRLDLLRFKITETALDQGVALIVNTLLDSLDQELRPLLDGCTWLTAPFDWGDDK